MCSRVGAVGAAPFSYSAITLVPEKTQRVVFFPDIILYPQACRLTEGIGQTGTRVHIVWDVMNPPVVGRGDMMTSYLICCCICSTIFLYRALLILEGINGRATTIKPSSVVGLTSTTSREPNP